MDIFPRKEPKPDWALEAICMLMGTSIAAAMFSAFCGFCLADKPAPTPCVTDRSAVLVATDANLSGLGQTGKSAAIRTLRVGEDTDPELMLISLINSSGVWTATLKNKDGRTTQPILRACDERELELARAKH